MEVFIQAIQIMLIIVFPTIKTVKVGTILDHIHKPVKLVYQEQFNTQSEALKREEQIKGWRREKKIRILGLKLD